MKKFKVTITEISKRSVFVAAEDQLEAEEQVNDLWNKGEIVLDANDFIEMNVTSEEEE